jgi:hypothetical protein
MEPPEYALSICANGVASYSQLHARPGGWDMLLGELAACGHHHGVVECIAASM